MTRRSGGWLIAMLTLSLFGCPPAATTVIDAPATHQKDELSLGPGDTFEVRVFGEPDLSGPYRLSEDGTIDYPLIGQLKLEGMDPHKAADEISRRLGEKYLKHPQVSIFVREQSSKKIVVSGKVAKAGTYPFLPGMTIVEGITVAGGFTDIAARSKVKLIRTEGGKTTTREIDVKAITDGEAPNEPLRAGDIIQVPERIF